MVLCKCSVMVMKYGPHFFYSRHTEKVHWWRTDNGGNFPHWNCTGDRALMAKNSTIENLQEWLKKTYSGKALKTIVFLIESVQGVEKNWWWKYVKGANDSHLILMLVWCSAPSPTKIYSKNFDIPFALTEY